MLYQSQRAPGESIAQSIGWARIETGCCDNHQAATPVSLDRLDTHSNLLASFMALERFTDLTGQLFFRLFQQPQSVFTSKYTPACIF